MRTSLAQGLRSLSFLWDCRVGGSDSLPIYEVVVGNRVRAVLKYADGSGCATETDNRPDASGTGESALAVFT